MLHEALRNVRPAARATMLQKFAKFNIYIIESSRHIYKLRCNYMQVSHVASMSHVCRQLFDHLSRASRLAD
jgi:hypothetical protein